MNMSSGNKIKYFYLFLTPCLLFILCLIAMASISSKMLNINGQSEHFCLIPNYGGKKIHDIV